MVAGNGTDFGLLCDACGRRVVGLGATLHNWDQAWAFMIQRGWTGSTSAIGAHRCQRCRTAEVDSSRSG